MKRLFAFGCSFTQYWRWPTWADALGRQVPWFENWGLCGAGNCYIFYSILECHRRYKLGPNDSVYVMWSNTSREDRYVQDRWLEGGNVYWLTGNPLGEDYIRRYACERGFFIRDMAVISATQDLMKSWGCDYRSFSMVPLETTNYKNELGDNPSLPNRDNRDVCDLYRSTLDNIGPSVYEVIFSSDWQSRAGIPDINDCHHRDFHPTPMEHVEFLDHVMPGTVTSETRAWMHESESLARTGNLTWKQPYRPQHRL
jgi:hypothetical protein